jgi:uracil-DNA glycosylase family 4
MEDQASKLERLSAQIVGCRNCSRLVEYREAVARAKRLSFRDWDYWGKPVPGFGDARAKLLIFGLAPAAHGANRTGRMFTGDRSGDFLYRALYNTGFANQPTSLRCEDGLKLDNVYISAVVRCAPPANKPLPSELANCQPYFEAELRILHPKAILVLGTIAMHSYLGALKREGKIQSLALYPFRHGACYVLGHDLPRLFVSYHPSQQNTFTGKLTETMLEEVLREIRQFLENERGVQTSNKTSTVAGPCTTGMRVLTPEPRRKTTQGRLKRARHRKG